MLNKMKKLLINQPTIIIAGLCIFYLLFSYFAINPLAKHIVPWVAEKQLASHASVGKVTFDPLRLKTTIENFNLTEKNGSQLASFKKLVVDLEANGLFDWTWKFKEISITAPRANITISPKGKLNWADLLAKLNEDKNPPDNKIPRVVINLFSVKQGNIQYIDANRPTPFKTGLAPLDFELDGFSTLPKDRGDYFLAAKLPEQGGSIKWKGDIGINPIASKGNIALNNIHLENLMQAVKNVTLPFKSASGDIQASFAYDFTLPKDQPKISLNNIVLALNNVAGKVTQTGDLSLKQANLVVPRLDFSMQDRPQLHLQNLDFKLNDFRLNQGKDAVIFLKQTSVTLPRLDFSMQNKPQLNFKDLKLKLTDLSLEKGQGNDNVMLFFLPQVDVNQVAFDLDTRNVKVAQVLLVNGTVNIARDKAGLVNWRQALATPSNGAEQSPTKPDNSETPETPPPFTMDIADIQMQHWSATYQDQGFVHPLQLNVADLNLGFVLATPQGNIEISKLQSKVNGFTVMSTLSKKPVATLDKLDLDQGEISLANQKVRVQSIELSGLKTELIKEANKPLNWQSILKPVPSTSGKTSAAPNKQSKKPDWAVSFKKLALDNSSLHVEDRSLTKPVSLDIEKAAFEMHDASLDLSHSVPVSAAFQVKQGGRFNAQGKLTPSPLKAALNFKLTKFALKPFSPYINQFALLKLNDGATDISGKLSVKEGKNLAIAFNGGFSVNKLSLVEEANDEPFLVWERVSSDSLEVTLAPNHVHMTELRIVKPTGKFIIHEDKSLNVTRILRNQPATTSFPAPVAPSSQPANETKSAESVHGSVTAETSTDVAKPTLAFGSPTPQPTVEKAQELPIPEISNNSSAEAFPIGIETVRIENAELDFADLSIKPQFGTHINSLSGVISGVSTNASSAAQVELDGKVDEYGSARIRGSIQPFKPTNFTDLILSFRNIEMSRLTPYSGKFAGRRIDSGKISVDLEYKIKQRQLAGTNKFIINQLKLGEKVNSAEAANLPLDLAIAILEDSDGVIDLDLPISGSLDDPKFSYGSIVWRAIKNVLSKIVTAPFRALGKLFWTGSGKLEAISFEVGSPALLPPEQEKLKAVSQVLSKRQGLALGIIPSYDSDLDSRALQEITLRRKLAQEMGIKLEDGQQPGPIDLSNPKTQKAIDDLHDKLTKKGLLKKLASKLGKPKEGHYQEALEKLTVSIEMTELDLQALARLRGETIQKALVDAGISADRVHVNTPVKTKADDKTVNTKLTLDVKGAKNKVTEPATKLEKPEQPENTMQPVSNLSALTLASLTVRLNSSCSTLDISLMDFKHHLCDESSFQLPKHPAAKSP